jgi:hypothetical protein
MGSLYDEDILAWSERQGALLRRIAAGERVNDADLDGFHHRQQSCHTVARPVR